MQIAPVLGCQCSALNFHFPQWLMPYMKVNICRFKNLSFFYLCLFVFLFLHSLLQAIYFFVNYKDIICGVLLLKYICSRVTCE